MRASVDRICVLLDLLIRLVILLLYMLTVAIQIQIMYIKTLNKTQYNMGKFV